jgi:glycosyltransferase involved in cell wall biosynthesis
LVSNGCRDESPEICRKLAERFGNVRAIDSAPGGWGLAVNLGIQSSRGDLLAFTNSARTDAQTLLSAISEALSHPDSVVKLRRSGTGFFRRVGSGIFNWECRMLLGAKCDDINGTPKLFPRRFERLLSMRSDGDLLDAEFCMLCNRHGYPIHEITQPRGPRHGGESTTKLGSAIRMYLGVIKLACGKAT